MPAATTAQGTIPHRPAARLLVTAATSRSARADDSFRFLGSTRLCAFYFVRPAAYMRPEYCIAQVQPCPRILALSVVLKGY